MSMSEFLSFFIPLLSVGVALGALFLSGINEIKQDLREDRNRVNRVQEHVSNVEIELGGRMAWIEGLLAARSEVSSAQSMYKFRMTEED